MSKHVAIKREEPKNWGALGLHPLALEQGRESTPKIKPLPICVTMSNLVVLCTQK